MLSLFSAKKALEVIQRRDALVRNLGAAVERGDGDGAQEVLNDLYLDYHDDPLVPGQVASALDTLWRRNATGALHVATWLMAHATPPSFARRIGTMILNMMPEPDPEKPRLMVAAAHACNAVVDDEEQTPQITECAVAWWRVMAEALIDGGHFAYAISACSAAALGSRSVQLRNAALEQWGNATLKLASLDTDMARAEVARAMEHSDHRGMNGLCMMEKARQIGARLRP